MNLLGFEQEYWQQEYAYVAGIDEAGRGPLAGPVVTAAVVFEKDQSLIEGIIDSKRLSARQRDLMYDTILKHASETAIVVIDHKEIDELNILGATYKGMMQATDNLSMKDYLLIDGKRGPKFDIPHRCIVKGDSLSMSIAAASILAKVTRDRMMIKYDEIYPEYGFAQHKGYPTRMHIKAIRNHGLCPIHRRSFRPKALEDLHEKLYA